MIRHMAELDLSVIIVNYNVKHYLGQCLRAVQRATAGMRAEIIVVDNASTDGSQAFLRKHFEEEVILIENRDNPGFSRANNQGIGKARGRYVLLLNPDTVVGEDTFTRCLAFMDQRPKAGALGVKMIDGQGKFLPESKRALPTPWVSFYKIFGLAALFPRSKRFGRYHLSFLAPEETHQVEILSGAFMWMRRSVLEEIGYLDEDFFMYGEDIDLSYRVIAAGYENYYFADTQIIHYKGESTKKGSLNYVRVFYQAMIIFAQKHFGGSRQRMFILAIRLAVYFRAAIAMGQRLVSRLGFPALEGALIYGVMYGIKAYWEHYVKYIEGGAYPQELVTRYMPVYTAVFVGFLWLGGGYKRPFRLRPLMLAPVWGFIAIATATYMFPAVQNFSRAIVGLSAVFTLLIALGTRGLINRQEKGSFFFTEEKRLRVILVGNQAGVARLTQLLRQHLAYPVDIAGAAGAESPSAWAVPYLGSLDSLPALVRAFDVKEVIFCNQSLPATTILQQLTSLQHLNVSIKIAPPNTDLLIGPQQVVSPEDGGQPYMNLQQRRKRLEKRMFDLGASLALLLSFPFLFWRYQRPGSAVLHLWQSLLGRRHLVGYDGGPYADLPPLKPGGLSLRDRVPHGPGLASRPLDAYYAQAFRWDLDFEVLARAWPRLGLPAASRQSERRQ
jgi:O-antigen biosynthesis protein